MDRVFEHFHLSLVERAQIGMFDVPTNREDWIRDCFGETFQFWHMGTEFHWVPWPEQPPFILGTVERIKLRPQHKAPEEGGEEFIGREWQGSLVIIDPRYRPDGQKVGFEQDRDVGQPHAVLASMARHLNGDGQNQFSIFVKPIFDSETFRRFAHRHGNVVRYITFDFVVPNMFFGARLGVKKGLERVGQDTGAEEVKVTLESETGVRTDSKNVEDALAYSEQGNARVTAGALTGEKYSSTTKRKTVKMRSILNLAQEASEEAKRWIRKALGRDENDSVDDADSGDSDTGGS